jgi:DNA mismatch repair ATPase MutS
MFAVFAVEYAFVRLFSGRVDEVLAGADRHGREFESLAALLVRIESGTFASRRLRELQAVIRTEGVAPTVELHRFVRLTELADMRRNVAYHAFGFVLAMTQVAFAMEAWRRRSGTALRHWLAAVGEFEALVSISGYAYEFPGDPFPELLDGPPVFEATALGHPLLDASTAVPNDIVLDREPQLVLVSGSNMSGKSTLLRTVGVNVVLALAGAPVRAERLRLSPVAIGATLRVQDSLQAGTSRFYAEIQRIRQIVGLTSGTRPVLFLLDELLHGTNSHDRAIGADGILRGLLDRGAIGLATTHDLALTRIATELGDRVRNVHFEDRIDGDTMVFDYRMRSGVVEKSNALELMRALGLDV